MVVSFGPSLSIRLVRLKECILRIVPELNKTCYSEHRGYLRKLGMARGELQIRNPIIAVIDCPTPREILRTSLGHFVHGEDRT